MFLKPSVRANPIVTAYNRCNESTERSSGVEIRPTSVGARIYPDRKKDIHIRVYDNKLAAVLVKDTHWTALCEELLH